MKPKKSVRSKLKGWARQRSWFGNTSEATESNSQLVATQVVNAPNAAQVPTGLINASTISTDCTAVENIDEIQSSDDLTLWDKALDYILKSMGTRRLLKISKSSAKDIKKLMEQAIVQRTNHRKVNAWKIRVGGTEYSVRGFIDKTVAILNRFVSVGDVVANIDPVHTALPWAAVRFVLISLDAHKKLSTDITFGLAKVTTLVFQCSTYQTLYNASNVSSKSHGDVLRRLEETMVQAYVRSLLFLGFAFHECDGSKTAVFKLDDMGTYTQNLLSSGNELSQAADDCERWCHNQNQANGAEVLRLARESHQAIHNQGATILDIHGYNLLSQLRHVEGAAYDSHANEHDPRCHKDTRVYLLDRIQDWAYDPDGEGIFWLQGMAGTGKSTIARTVAQMFDNTRELGASFFFKRGEGDRSRAAYFFATICQQLCHKLPLFAKHAQEAIRDDPGIPQKSITQQFEKLLMEPLQRLEGKIYGPTRILVVIDALDECDTEADVERIISLASKTRSLTSIDIRFLITSRPEYHILVGFDDAERGSYKDVALHKISDSVVEQDICTYLLHELTTIRDNYNRRPLAPVRLSDNWPSKEEIQVLVEMAVPLFIFAATVCRFLADRPVSNPADRLAQVLKHSTGTHHDKLTATYSPVLDRLITGKSETEKAELICRFRDIIGSIVLLAEPLSVSSLSSLLEITLDDIADILNNLHSVLRVPSDIFTPVRIFHLSFREFMVDKRRRETNKFWVEAEGTHKALATKCLDVLFRHDNLRYNMCHLDSFGVPRKEITQKVLDDSLPQDVQYACLYWIYHLKEAKVIVDDQHQAFRFLQEHFLHWLEALSIMGRLLETIPLVQELQTIVDHSHGIKMLEFLYDAQRFILRFRTAIDHAPLQLYSSALLFSPQQSAIKQRFQERHTNWVIQKPITESDWDPCLQIIEGHKDSVFSIQWSDDGKLIASGSMDKRVNIWDTKKMELRYRLRGHKDYVFTVVFSSDSKLIASGSADTTIKIWDTATGELWHTLEGHGHSIFAVRFSNNCKLIASASQDKTVKIWDASTGKLQWTLENHKDGVSTIAFSSDDQLIATGSKDGTRIWDVMTGKLQQTLQNACYVQWLAFLRNDSLITYMQNENKLVVWDTSNGVLQRNIDCEGRVNSLAISSDSKLIALGLIDGTIDILDMKTNEIERKVQAYTNPVRTISFSPDCRLIASVAMESTVRIWDITKETAPKTLECHESSVTSIAFLLDGQLVASGSVDHTVKIWDAMKATVRHTLKGHTRQIYAMVPSLDSMLLATASQDDTIKIWDPIKGKLNHTLEGHTSAIGPISFSADSNLLASGSYDNTIKIWDPKKGSLWQTLKGHTEFVQRVVFSPDSTLLASLSKDMTIKIWDPTNGILLETLLGHGRPIRIMLFSNNSKQLATSESKDQTIKIWDMTKRAMRHILKDHTDWIEEMVFSADSRILMSGSWDRTIKIWDPIHGTLWQTVDIGFLPLGLSFHAATSQLRVERGSLQIPIKVSSGSSKPQGDVPCDDEVDLCTSGEPLVSCEAQPIIRITDPKHHPYGLDLDQTWIQCNGNNLLWIPPEYRPARGSPSCHAVSPTKKRISLGCDSGRVLLIGFED